MLKPWQPEKLPGADQLDLLLLRHSHITIARDAEVDGLERVTGVLAHKTLHHTKKDAGRPRCALDVGCESQGCEGGDPAHRTHELINGGWARVVCTIAATNLDVLQCAARGEERQRLHCCRRVVHSETQREASDGRAREAAEDNSDRCWAADLLEVVERRA